MSFSYWWGATLCEMQGLHHNWQDTLFTCSQVGYFDETWRQEESIKGFAKTQCQERWML
jgi:hypothetical protein